MHIDFVMCKKGTLLDLLTYILLQNFKKKLEEGPFGDIKIFFEKKSHSAEKNRKGGPFSLVSGFVGYVKSKK